MSRLIVVVVLSGLIVLVSCIYRFAVEEWIRSGYPLHFMRDHPFQCKLVNGGLMGGRKGALQGSVESKIRGWSDRENPYEFQRFVDTELWPSDNSTQITHDSYCCTKFTGTIPFPTQRDMYYHYVGEVFDEKDKPKAKHVDKYMRGVRTMDSCRKYFEWIYG